MRVLLSYPTSVGIFDIGQSRDKRYHVIFDDTSLGDFDSVQGAVDALVSNQTISPTDIETKELIDTSTLGIAKDYLEWDSNY